MKLKVLILLLLFIITTTFASIHETKHIFDGHDASECPVCIVSHNLISDDLNIEFNELTLFISEETILLANTSYKYKTIISNYSNAPPKNA